MRVFAHLSLIVTYGAAVAAAVSYWQQGLSEVHQNSYLIAGLVFALLLFCHGALVVFRVFSTMKRRQDALEKDIIQTLRKVDDYDARLVEFNHVATQGFTKITTDLMTEIRQLHQLVLKAPAEKPFQVNKSAGPGTHKIMDDRVDNLLAVVKNAISDNRLDLHVQPIVGLPNRRAKFYECFVRVRDENGDIIFPLQFMDDAEASGLSSALDNLILFKCVQMIRQLGPRRPRVKFFYNVSIASLLDRAFQSQFVEFLCLNKELANRLVFEFDFEEFQENAEKLGVALAQLREAGYQFSLEGVLMGALKPAECAELSVRFLKIKAQELLESEGSGDILLSDLADHLERFNIDLVATHVENEADAIRLIENNLKFGQGYLFGEPKEAKLTKANKLSDEQSRVA